MAPNRPAASEVDEKLELARAVAGVLGARDLEHLERHFHPDVEFHDAWAMGAGVYQGLPGIRQLYADLGSVWEEFVFEPLELESTPDGRVLMTARQVTRKPTRREIERTMYFVLGFRDGKLVSWDGWHLQAGARVAAGFS